MTTQTTPRILVSIVTYHSDLEELCAAIASVKEQAVASDIKLIDNHCEAAYAKALERFASIQSSRLEARVEGVDSAAAAIRLLFEATIHRSDAEPKGCMLVNTAVELSGYDPEAAARANEALEDTEALIERLVRHGQASGEISSRHTAQALAASLNNALIGLRVMVKTVKDKDKLEMIVNTTLAMLE